MHKLKKDNILYKINKFFKIIRKILVDEVYLVVS